MFPDTVPGPDWIKILFDETGSPDRNIFGYTRNFIFINIYYSRISGTTCPAPLAFKMNSMIKKIGSIV